MTTTTTRAGTPDDAAQRRRVIALAQLSRTHSSKAFPTTTDRGPVDRDRLRDLAWLTRPRTGNGIKARFQAVEFAGIALELLDLVNELAEEVGSFHHETGDEVLARMHATESTEDRSGTGALEAEGMESRRPGGER